MDELLAELEAYAKRKGIAVDAAIRMALRHGLTELKREEAVTKPAKPFGEREDVERRAGTRINHAHTTNVFGRAEKGRRVHGLIDRSQKLYQCGGERHNFIFKKENLVSIGGDVWDQIKDAVERIEIIDHTRNEAWCIGIESAKKYGRFYNAGIGPRYGIPVEHFLVVDYADKIIQLASKR